MTKPDHVDGKCDIAGCSELASRAFSDGERYLEVCSSHADGFRDRFDSDYDRVPQDSPHREPPIEERVHSCGADLYIYSVSDSATLHICTGCGYALLVENEGSDKFSVDISR